MTELLLSQAIYGPQPNGSAVQLLAQSADIDGSVLGEFSNFYFAAWEISRSEPEPFLTFIPLGEGQWGLIRSQVLGERSLGVMFLSHLWIVTARDLERIGWRSSRLWEAMLQQPLFAPEIGSVLDPVAVSVTDAPPEAGGTVEQADALAFAVHQAVQQGGAIQIPALSTFPDPQVGLFHVIERLGPMMQGVSYCSSAAMAGSQYQQLSSPSAAASAARQPISILASTAEVSGQARTVVSPATRLSEHWIEYRLRHHGIAPGELRRDARTLRELAVCELEARRDAILVHHNFQQIGDFARERRAGRAPLIAPFLLAETLRQLGNPRIAARALDEFVIEHLQHCPNDKSLPPPAATVADAAAQTGAIFWAGRETIRALPRAELYGTDRDRDDGVRELLEASLSHWLGAMDAACAPALVALFETMPTTPAFAPLRQQLAALFAVVEGTPFGLLERILDEAENLADAEAQVRALVRMLPPGSAATGTKRLHELLAKRVMRVLRTPPSLDEGLRAVLMGMPQLVTGGGE